MTQRFSLSIDSHIERLGEVADFIEGVARACALNESQAYDVQMAVDEAVTNIIEHAYRGRPGGEIDLVVEKRGKELIITIQDFGEPFDPNQVAKPKTHAPLSERDIGGLGLFFMKKLMDRVEFDFSPEGGNRLTMVKKIKK